MDGYYHDRRLSIAYVRSLAYSTCGATSAAGVETMLDRLSIASDHHYGTTIGLIKQIVANRNRPVIFAVRMGLIPYTYSKDTFTGNHWLVACANSTDVYGQTGVTCMDPNAPSSTGAFHFLPDWAISRSLIGDAVIPAYAKRIVAPTVYVHVKPGVNIRNGPGTLYPLYRTTTPTYISPLALKFGGYVAGQAYSACGSTGSAWAKVNLNGLWKYVAKPCITPQP